jgi:hypothetical protein
MDGKVYDEILPPIYTILTRYLFESVVIMIIEICRIIKKLEAGLTKPSNPINNDHDVCILRHDFIVVFLYRHFVCIFVPLFRLTTFASVFLFSKKALD